MIPNIICLRCNLRIYMVCVQCNNSSSYYCCRRTKLGQSVNKNRRIKSDVKNKCHGKKKDVEHESLREVEKKKIVFTQKERKGAPIIFIETLLTPI